MAKVIWEGRTALVTGASSGLGDEFARTIAARGGRLVLVARSADKLRVLAEQLPSVANGPHLVISADLGKLGECERIFLELAEMGVTVEHLINNAGVGRARAVAKDDAETLVNLVQVNCTALTELTASFIPGMVERGSGGVLQISSVVGFTPSPYMAAYAASKAYVKSFTEGLAVELEGTGVRVTAVCPGHVRTGFQVAAGFSTNALAVPGELSAKETVRRGLLAYERGQTVAVTGFMNRLSVFFGGLLPRSWVAKISANILKKTGRFD